MIEIDYGDGNATFFVTKEMEKYFIWYCIKDNISYISFNNKKELEDWSIKIKNSIDNAQENVYDKQTIINRLKEIRLKNNNKSDIFFITKNKERNRFQYLFWFSQDVPEGVLLQCITFLNKNDIIEWSKEMLIRTNTAKEIKNEIIINRYKELSK